MSKQMFNYYHYPPCHYQSMSIKLIKVNVITFFDRIIYKHF